MYINQNIYKLSWFMRNDSTLNDVKYQFFSEGEDEDIIDIIDISDSILNELVIEDARNPWLLKWILDYKSLDIDEKIIEYLDNYKRNQISLLDPIDVSINFQILFPINTTIKQFIETLIKHKNIYGYFDGLYIIQKEPYMIVEIAWGT